MRKDARHLTKALSICVEVQIRSSLIRLEFWPPERGFLEPDLPNVQSAKCSNGIRSPQMPT